MLKFAVRCLHTKSKTSEMVRILNVAEKNDAAKSISEIMSGGRYRKREGFSRFNKIYEFEYNILNQNCTMSMSSVSGHLLEFRFVGQYTKWHGCSPAALFQAPMEKYCPENFVDIKRTLEREVRGCQTLIIWTDGDREGENIGYEIIRVCQAVKANLRVYRARFSEITPQAITRAVRSLEQPNINVSDAVDVRQELDLRIGAAFTRFQTMRLQKVFPDVLAEQMISYGSCQFPTLGFVVERYKQVQAFIAEQFWKISATIETEDGVAEFHWKRQRLFDHTACLVLYLHCLEDPTATVTDVRSRPKSRWRPVALDTVELEKLASRKLRINAKETMKIAEKLYTQGCISYPRTETNMFPAGFDLTSLVQHQTQDPQWGGFAARLLEAGLTPRNGNKTDHAHPPIHPTKYVGALQGNEKRVYEFIVRHFLACCSQDAQGHETTIEIDVNGEQFSLQGLMIIARNYLDVYPYDKWNAKVIPTMEIGQTFQPKSVEMTEGETSPPSLLTEADLISLMDKHGIGTDATHADHIEKIKSRLYVGLTPDGKFLPGELGMGLVEGYDAMGFEMSKPHLRSELEADLKRICEGTKDKNDVLQSQVVKYRDVFMEVVRQAVKIDTALAEYFGNAQQVNQDVQETLAPSVVRPCPNCSNDMLLKRKKDGRGWFLSCMGYPECRAAIWFPDFVLHASVDDAICDICEPRPTHKIEFKFKKGSVPPYIPLDYVGCIGGCDETLVELLDIRRTVRRNPQATTGGNQQTGANRNRGSNNSNLGSGVPRNNGHGNSGNPGHGGNSGMPRNSGFGNSGNPGNGGNSGMPRNSGFGNSGNPGNGGNSGMPRNSGYGNSGNPGNGTPRDSGYGDSYASSGPQSGSMNRSQTRVPPTRQGSTSDAGSAGDQDGNTVVCLCGKDARQLTVRKEGPNTGRQFYTCAQPQDSRCDFFLWSDAGGNAGSSGSGTGAPGMAGQAQQGGRFGGAGFRGSDSSTNRSCSVGSAFDDDAVSCGCGIEAKLLTVHKEGPNTGRQFYSCSKPRGEGCSFFQWADEGSSNSRGGFPAKKGREGGGVKRHASSDKEDGKVTKKRKCGICGEEGHTRRTCPRNT